MRFWGKKQLLGSSHQGVAALAVSGAPRKEWIREAISEIVGAGEVARVGIWLEPDAASEAALHGLFRGLEWDVDLAETPPDWNQLSAEAPLPDLLLNGMGIAEIDLESSPTSALLGPLLELRRAFWAPVGTPGRLRGIVLVGFKQRSVIFSTKVVQQIASELTLALHREEEQQRARAQGMDLGLSQEILQGLSARLGADTLLARLVESCLPASGKLDAPGALFAAIGAAESESEVRKSSRCSPMHFCWKAGDFRLEASLGSGPLHEVWRTAVDLRRVQGADLSRTTAPGLPGRAIAIPRSPYLLFTAPNYRACSWRFSRQQQYRSLR